jgi:hypothetical protein
VAACVGVALGTTCGGFVVGGVVAGSVVGLLILWRSLKGGKKNKVCRRIEQVSKTALRIDQWVPCVPKRFGVPSV